MEQSRYLASTARMSWCTLEARKCKKRNHNGGHDDFLCNCSIGYKRRTVNVALIASMFSQVLLQENFQANGGFHPKQKLGTSTKSKLLEFVNSMKLVFLFSGLNLNTIVQDKTPDKCTFYE